MIYEFSYEVYAPVLKILHVTMSVEVTPVETYNRFGPMIQYQLGARDVIEIHDEAGRLVTAEFKDHIPEILDHFHEVHVQRLIDKLHAGGQ